MPGVAPRSSTDPNQEWRGLAATLTALNDEQLSRLLTLRPDLLHPAPRDMQALAGRAGAWSSARECYFSLDRACQYVVEALCLLPQLAAHTDVAAFLGVPAGDAELAAALRRLEERGLAFALGAGVGPPDQVQLLPALRQLDYPARLGPPLAPFLRDLSGPALDQMAQRHGVKPAKVKPDTLALIVSLLSDPDHVSRLVESGPAGTLDLARRAAADGPLVHVTQGLYGISDRTAAGWMVNRGLLGIVDYYTGVMPREPAIALRGGRVFPPSCLRRPDLDLRPVDPGAVDRTAAERATRVVADVVAILDLWSAEPPAILKAGGIGIREVRKAAKAVDRTETETARIIDLAGIAGLTRVDLVAAHAAPTAAYDEWLGLESPQRWAWLTMAWLDAALHLSLAGAISTKDKPIPPLLARSPERDAIRRRQLVASILTGVSPGSAASPAGVRDHATWTSPAAWAGGPAAAATLIAWVMEEVELLGIAGLGAVSTAGGAVLAGDPVGAVAALAALVPPSVAEFVIQADLTAVIAGEPAAAMRAELDLLADVESKGAATVYRFSEGSLRRAFDAGRTPADIIGFLERHATRGVPQPLNYLVADLGRRFGNVRVGAVAAYLRSDDPSLLAEVLQARATSKLRLRRIAPTVLVTDADAATVTTTLQAAGYLPAREAVDGSLLLARPAARRVATRAFPAPHVPARADVADVVADLRRAPAPQPARPPSPPAYTPPSHPALFSERPTEIVKESTAVRMLLSEACAEYWVVRLSYVASNGHATEFTVEPSDIDGRHLYAACFPRGNERRFVLDRIEWARVLTDAEEDLLP